MISEWERWWVLGTFSSFGLCILLKLVSGRPWSNPFTCKVFVGLVVCWPVKKGAVSKIVAPIWLSQHRLPLARYIKTNFKGLAVSG